MDQPPLLAKILLLDSKQDHSRQNPHLIPWLLAARQAAEACDGV